MLTWEHYAVTVAVLIAVSIIRLAVRVNRENRAERSLMTPEQKKTAEQEDKDDLYIW